MRKNKNDIPARVFTRAIGDKIRMEQDKKLGETIRQHSLSLLEKVSEKNSAFRRKSLQALTQANKQSTDTQANIKTFIKATLVQIVAEYNVMIKSELVEAIEKDIKHAEMLNKLAEEKGIEEFKRAYQFYKSINGDGANIKVLNWFVQTYATHVNVLAKYDVENNSNMTDLFLTGINQQLPVLHSRFASLALEKLKHLEEQLNHKEI